MRAEDRRSSMPILDQLRVKDYVNASLKAQLKDVLDALEYAIDDLMLISSHSKERESEQRGRALLEEHGRLHEPDVGNSGQLND